MTNDKLYTYRDNASVSVGYDDPKNTPGNEGGWFIILNMGSLAAEYGISEETAKEIIRDFNLKEQ